jgi:hypothetical protein
MFEQFLDWASIALGGGAAGYAGYLRWQVGKLVAQLNKDIPALVAKTEERADRLYEKANRRLEDHVRSRLH